MSQGLSTEKVDSWSAIIQARMGATRLPGKVLMDLGGKPIIAHVVERIKFCEPEKIILAIPDGKSDDRLFQWASDNEIECIRGPEDDVLSRFLLASQNTDSLILVRVTADNPFVEPEIIKKTISNLIRQITYQDNVNVTRQIPCQDDVTRQITCRDNDSKPIYCVMEGSPLGTTIEAFTRDALLKLDSLARTPDEREHVTLAVWNNPDEFQICVLDAPSHLRCDGLRLTIDTERDFELARFLFRALAGDIRMIALREIIKYVNHNPLVLRINGGVEQKMSEWLKERKSKPNLQKEKVNNVPRA